MDREVPIMYGDKVWGYTHKDENGAYYVRLADVAWGTKFDEALKFDGSDWLGYNVGEYIRDCLLAEPTPEAIHLEDGVLAAEKVSGFDHTQKLYDSAMEAVIFKRHDPHATGVFEGAEEDPVNHPKHYNSHPSGVECIEITRHMGFNLGNTVKYIWRDGLKDETAPLQDLRKALWYLQDEIAMREKTSNAD